MDFPLKNISNGQIAAGLDARKRHLAILKHKKSSSCEEYKKDEEGFRQHYLYPLEQVMDWQITANKDDEPYFKTHPDVHKSKYINAPVVKVIGGRYEINSIDKIALVLGVKEAEE